MALLLNTSSCAGGYGIGCWSSLWHCYSIPLAVQVGTALIMRIVKPISSLVRIEHDFLLACAAILGCHRLGQQVQGITG